MRSIDGKAEILDSGVHFRLYPFDKFGETFSKALDFINFGPIIRVRIKPGYLGAKTNRDGLYEELQPGIHEIKICDNETFDEKNDIQDIGQDDFRLGGKRYVTIRNGELGESYKNGIFQLLEPGRHALPADHIFVKKQSIQHDVVDLGAYKIITVKEGQVAVINTQEGVVKKGPGKHEIKQEEGNFFNTILTTCPQGVTLPSLTVMCSDQIEMKAESMMVYAVEDPLKTVGLGIDVIIDMLKKYADGTLRNILSRYSSADIAPSLHIDEEHHSSKRSDKLEQIHDNLVDKLDIKAQEWGLRISDLQITQILPADGVYHETLRQLGTQQSTSEANRRLADTAVVIAEIQQREALSRVKTESDVRRTKTDVDAYSEVESANAKSKAILAISGAENERIRQMIVASTEAPDFIQDLLLQEVRNRGLAALENPVVFSDLGTTVDVRRTNKGVRFFTSAQNTQDAASQVFNTASVVAQLNATNMSGVSPLVL